MKPNQDVVKSTTQIVGISAIENQSNHLLATSSIDLTSTEDNRTTFPQIKQLIYEIEVTSEAEVT